MKFPMLETNRLRLRHFTASDTAALFAYRSHAETARFQNRAGYTPEQAREFVLWAESTAFGERGWFAVAIEDRGSGTLIGDVAFNLLDVPRTAELGYTLAHTHWGQGLASEAVRAVLNVLFDPQGLNLHRVIAYVAVQNPRSWSLLERLGFRREGHNLESYLVNGTWVNEYQYALLAHEWRGANPAV